jgi:hypothetical protein
MGDQRRQAERGYRAKGRQRTPVAELSTDKAMLTQGPKVVWLGDGAGWHKIRDLVIFEFFRRNIGSSEDRLELRNFETGRFQIDALSLEKLQLLR